VRFTPFDRQRIEVAQQLEHDDAAVGLDVERQPGRLLGGELEGALRLERQPSSFFSFLSSAVTSAAATSSPSSASAKAAGTTIMMRESRQTKNCGMRR
jgi:hypothetical protein